MPESTGVVRLQPIKRDTIPITVIGITPVIPHKWSEKSLRMMRDKQSGSKARPKHDPKDAEAEAEASLYRLPDGRPGLPAVSFKAALVGACRHYEGVTMTALKTAVFVLGEGPDQLVPLTGEMTLREDTPRNSTGGPDLRYRYAFFPWSVDLAIEYMTSVIDPESVVNLLDTAGTGGVGDWRPSAPKSLTGTYGRFGVKR